MLNRSRSSKQAGDANRDQNVAVKFMAVLRCNRTVLDWIEDTHSHIRVPAPMLLTALYGRSKFVAEIYLEVLLE